jgi:protein TIF31
LEGLDDK